MFAFEPLHGYGDDRSAPELPWDSWAREAGSRGMGVADLFGDAGEADGGESPPGRSG